MWTMCEQHDLKSRSLGLFAAVVAFLASVPSLAAGDPAGANAIGERPNEGGPPEEVTVALGLLDIDAIIDKDQRFSVDAYVEVRWTDDRLAIGANEGPARRTFQLGEIWTPGLTIVNNRGLSLILPEVAEVDREGNVVLRQRVAGQLAVELDLREFPFDTQVLALDVISYRHPPSELVYSTDSFMAAKVDQFSAGGWRFEALSPQHSVFRLAENGTGTSMLTFAVRAERNAAYYVLTLALPMILILALAWMVHWLPTDVIPARIGMSTATVFSLIALGVSLRLDLPRIVYLTRADLFVILSTLLVLLSLAVAVLTTRWLKLDREDDAERLTRYARLSFLFLLVLIIAVTLV
jgi:hypothetical protein